MNTAALNNLWSYLQGLSLTATNQRWLASHLIEAAENMEKGEQKKELAFPKIPKDYMPSERVMAMTLGTLPDDVDLENEIRDLSALPYQPDLIITRDKKGFQDFDILVMTPAEFVSKAKE